MDNRYLCYLIFILFKFIFKNFIYLKIVFDTMLSPINHFPYIYILVPIQSI